jgi:FKBP-type peptidyl-prolyl cis-trans isomerase
MMMATFFLRRQPVVVQQSCLTVFLLLLIALSTPDFQHRGIAQAWLLSSSTTTRVPRRRISKAVLHYASSADRDVPQRRNGARDDVPITINPSSSSSSSSSLLAPKCRRDVLHNSLFTFLATTTTMTLSSTKPAHALVKGNAPPPRSKPPGSSVDKPKCTNVEECQALAEQKEQLERQEAAASDTLPAQTTRGGTRYKDLDLGNDTGSGSSVLVQNGDEVTLHYKVLKLGKRSYDGLSGEGTVIFSRGYGLEDDEVIPGDKSFTTTVGAPYNIIALNEALLGMRVGGKRRFSIFPSQGWRIPGRDCDGGPGGMGAGGDVKTDYVVVPTAQIVAAEACLDATKLPFPTSSYGQQRRMAQRFDQSLIMEVQVVSINAPGGGLF